MELGEIGACAVNILNVDVRHLVGLCRESERLPYQSTALGKWKKGIQGASDGNEARTLDLKIVVDQVC